MTYVAREYGPLLGWCVEFVNDSVGKTIETGLDETTARERAEALNSDRVIGADAARAVDRFNPEGPSGYVARSGGELRETRAEAETDEHVTLTRRERMERRAERRREWAGGREAKAEAAWNASHAISEHIPMGQPILVGHHSEKRARRDMGRMRSLADKGVEHSNMAEHHASRAEGIERQLRNSIFSDDHDAIEQLDAKIAKLEAERDRIKAYNKTCKKGEKHGDLSILDEFQQKRLLSYFACWPGGLKDGRWPDLTNLGAKIRGAKKRRDQLAAKQSA